MYNDMAQLWVRSSPGRAPPWHGGGSEFDPRPIHHKCTLPEIICRVNIVASPEQNQDFFIYKEVENLLEKW